MRRRLVPAAYRPVLANRVFRRLVLGFAVSYLGDGDGDGDGDGALGAVACVLLLAKRRNR
ncbi:hypothetical protein [Saccharopolyspora pogona]|uniref:hypothetical protein n=1 Tax=Saccharopolyspora pogona TaxID=333966 RepID=UPI0016849DF9|nr:hypothetical protein [Saccharopolyspora pogona]